VAHAAIGTHVQVPFDVRGHVAAQIALDLYPLIEDLANLRHVIVADIIRFQVERNARLL